MADDEAGCDTWAFARGTSDLSRELEMLTEDALRRVGRLSSQSRQLLKLLLDGCGNEDMVAITGLTSAEIEKAREQMLAELDATSTTDAIRIGICAAYRPPRDG